MPEVKFFEPAPGQALTDLRGRELSLQQYRGRRIKRAKRDGSRVIAVLDLGHNRRGLTVVFPTVDSYEASVRRVLRENP